MMCAISFRTSRPPHPSLLPVAIEYDDISDIGRLENKFSRGKLYMSGDWGAKEALELYKEVIEMVIVAASDIDKPITHYVTTR